MTRWDEDDGVTVPCPALPSLALATGEGSLCSMSGSVTAAAAAAAALDVGERRRARFGIGWEIGDDDSS